ncbi:hypothetical protein NIES2109_58320 (plasmid) [Nostoc sp. HK-01]|nr:hypothetical protein NIES2109_58320 [Nostoc sp. HK-01]
MTKPRFTINDFLRLRSQSCQQRFPDSWVNYVVADLFALPEQWHSGFNFVFKCRNIQALPVNVRSGAISSGAALVAPSGTLLLITRVREKEAQPLGLLGRYQN